MMRGLAGPPYGMTLVSINDPVVSCKHEVEPVVVLDEVVAWLCSSCLVRLNASRQPIDDDGRRIVADLSGGLGYEFGTLTSPDRVVWM